LLILQKEIVRRTLGADVAELSETYIHLRPFDPSEAVLQELGRAADSIAYNVARDVYGTGVEVEVTLEKGSLKSWITVSASSIFLIYGGVANYKGFKESVLEMCKDARRFGFNIYQKFESAAGTSEKQIYRVEKRLKTPGRISRLIRRMERLEKNMDKLDHQQVQRELIGARQQLEVILVDLPAEDANVLQQQLQYRKLPPIKQWPEPPPSHDHFPNAVGHPATYRQDGQSITIEDRTGLIPVKRLP
jgi:hypothetical protein